MVKEVQMKYYTQQILHFCFETVNPSRFQWIEIIFNHNIVVQYFNQKTPTNDTSKAISLLEIFKITYIILMDTKLISL